MAAPKVPPASRAVSLSEQPAPNYAASAAFSWCSFAINRDLRRAALFLWMTPLLATRSNVLIAAATAAAAIASSPAVIASLAFRTVLRAVVRCGWFRNRRRSATRIRFNADLLFANPNRPLLSHPVAGSHTHSAAFASPSPWYQSSPVPSRARKTPCPTTDLSISLPPRTAALPACSPMLHLVPVLPFRLPLRATVTESAAIKPTAPARRDLA